MNSRHCSSNATGVVDGRHCRRNSGAEDDQHVPSPLVLACEDAQGLPRAYPMVDAPAMSRPPAGGGSGGGALGRRTSPPPAASPGPVLSALRSDFFDVMARHHVTSITDLRGASHAVAAQVAVSLAVLIDRATAEPGVAERPHVQPQLQRGISSLENSTSSAAVATSAGNLGTVSWQLPSPAVHGSGGVGGGSGGCSAPTIPRFAVLGSSASVDNFGDLMDHVSASMVQSRIPSPNTVNAQLPPGTKQVLSNPPTPQVSPQERSLDTPPPVAGRGVTYCRTMSLASAASAMTTHPQLQHHVVQDSALVHKGHNKDGEKVINDYTVIGELGQGASAKVKLALNARDEYRAIKILKWKMKARKMSDVFHKAQLEIAIMKKVVHPNLVRLYEVINDESNNKIYLVMQYCAGGQVVKLRPDNTCDPLPLEQVKIYFKQLVSALRVLHHNNIFHRDVKTSNILKDEEGNCYLADFGVAAVCTGDDGVEGFEGTINFMPPEVLRNCEQVDAGRVDVWSLGVTIFLMLYGRLPFHGETPRGQLLAILRATLEFPPTGGSAEINALLARMLERDPAQRITIRQLHKHRFMRSVVLPGSRVVDDDGSVAHAPPLQLGTDASSGGSSSGGGSGSGAKATGHHQRPDANVEEAADEGPGRGAMRCGSSTMRPRDANPFAGAGIEEGASEVEVGSDQKDDADDDDDDVETLEEQQELASMVIHVTEDEINGAIVDESPAGGYAHVFSPQSNRVSDIRRIRTATQLFAIPSGGAFGSGAGGLGSSEPSSAEGSATSQPAAILGNIGGSDANSASSNGGLFQVPRVPSPMHGSPSKSARGSVDGIPPAVLTTGPSPRSARATTTTTVPRALYQRPGPGSRGAVWGSPSDPQPQPQPQPQPPGAGATQRAAASGGQRAHFVGVETAALLPHPGDHGQLAASGARSATGRDSGASDTVEEVMQPSHSHSRSISHRSSVATAEVEDAVEEANEVVRSPVPGSQQHQHQHQRSLGRTRSAISQGPQPPHTSAGTHGGTSRGVCDAAAKSAAGSGVKLSPGSSPTVTPTLTGSTLSPSCKAGLTPPPPPATMLSLCSYKGVDDEVAARTAEALEDEQRSGGCTSGGGGPEEAVCHRLSASQLGTSSLSEALLGQS